MSTLLYLFKIYRFMLSSLFPSVLFEFILFFCFWFLERETGILIQLLIKDLPIFSAIHFLSVLLYVGLNYFIMLYLYFNSLQCIFIPFVTSLTHYWDRLEICCLISKYLGIFLFLFCSWYIVWFHYGQRTAFCMILIISNLKVLIYYIEYDHS